MKITFYIFLFLTLLSCNKREEENISQKLNGFWFNDDKILLFRDSVMMHPIYEAPGLFEFTINDEMLIVKNTQEYFENIYDTCFVKLEKDNELTLAIDDVGYTFQKFESTQGMNFNRLYFEIEPCHGFCPVFQVEIFPDGTVNFNGIEYTEIEGPNEYNFNIEIINEINNLLEVVKIIDYPDDKFSNPPDSPRFNMGVEYPNGLKISIIDGLFEGKYENIIRYFYFFERQLIENSP
ncbi:DUF6438 domain-containing protein [Cyclobacterium sp. 1_MG-2023]|uniref:DUF6438 domain-containing protein n=1 Tax=Cyclobacterium sp. 1_MG-2023 TaxID=3062681 RepID=UPI0026E1BA0E|nr:DUF6438 domain-containing protein [Cyclobacterium sp. 1_MG-2023]MDO6440462.1 DUF6438 domain-containing protein [Cyclobacterium sp. 1_MG-2023]